MGILENVPNYKTPESRLRRSLYLRWFNMIDRCCNSESQSYAYYGGVGVTVHPSWMIFENFVADAPFIPGFNMDQILAGGVHLDKDSRIFGNKIYSKDTCVLCKCCGKQQAYSV